MLCDDASDRWFMKEMVAYAGDDLQELLTKVHEHSHAKTNGHIRGHIH